MAGTAMREIGPTSTGGPTVSCGPSLRGDMSCRIGRFGRTDRGTSATPIADQMPSRGVGCASTVDSTEPQRITVMRDRATTGDIETGRRHE